jgi:hypothetical protein
MLPCVGAIPPVANLSRKVTYKHAASRYRMVYATAHGSLHGFPPYGHQCVFRAGTRVRLCPDLKVGVKANDCPPPINTHSRFVIRCCTC